MPAFVKTKSDESRWAKAKEAAGKSTAKDSENYWRLSNYIYHKMGKTEEDIKMATELEKGLLKPMKMASTSVKTPKSKKLPGPFDKPSIFFKNEDLNNIKHPSVQKLWDFLMNRSSKRQSYESI